jgi:plasmid stability protein
VVRNLEEDLAKKLKQRARRHGRSMGHEVRHILRTAVQRRPVPPQKLGTRIARRFRGAGLSTDLPELRGATAVATEFDRDRSRHEPVWALMRTKPDAAVVEWLDRQPAKCSLGQCDARPRRASNSVSL